MIYRIQPEPFVDNIVDGHEMTKLPYPFFVDEAGDVQRQDVWNGDPAGVLGFQRDLARQRVDLWWEDFLQLDPAAAVGMYLVSVDRAGKIGVHVSAVAEVECLAGS